MIKLKVGDRVQITQDWYNLILDRTLDGVQLIPNAYGMVGKICSVQKCSFDPCSGICNGLCNNEVLRIRFTLPYRLTSRKFCSKKMEERLKKLTPNLNRIEYLELL